MASARVGPQKILVFLLAWVGLWLWPVASGTPVILGQGTLPQPGEPAIDWGLMPLYPPPNMPFGDKDISFGDRSPAASLGEETPEPVPGERSPSLRFPPFIWDVSSQLQPESAPRSPVNAQGIESPRFPAAAQGVVEEVQPSEYWLPGKSGTLQPVINIPFEVFERIYAELQSGGQPPPYTLVRFTFDGFAQGERAELRVELEVHTAGGSWVPVPLGLDSGALLADSLQYEGPGRHFMAFDERRGYVLWVRSDGDGAHRLSFRLLVPVVCSKDTAELRLYTPQATSAEGRLEIKEGHLVLEVGEGLQVRASESGEGVSRIEVVGVGGQLGRGGQMIIRWRRKASTDPGTTIVRLDVAARQHVRLLTQHLLTTAELQLRPLGGAIEQADIVLPPGADVLPSEAAGQYQLLPVEDQGKSSEATVVRVVFPEPQRTLITVTLAWRQMFTTQGEELPLGIRSVRQAARHYGVVMVTSSSWRPCQWQFSGDVRRVDSQTLTDPVRKAEEILAAFEYYSEAFELRMRCAPEKTQIVVAPEYEITVGAEYARLTARWRLFVRGVPASAIELLTQGWQIEQVEPESLVSPEVVLSELSETQSLRLSQPIIGPSEMVITARRKLDPTQGRLKLGLLLPKADVLAAGPVTVRCEENVEILFDMAESKGLRRQTGPVGPELSGPPARGYFRLEPAVSGSPLLVFDRWVHRQEVTLTSETTVSLRPGKGTVEQRIEYQIAYQPLQHLTFALPEVLARSNGVEFYLDGERVFPLRLATEPVGAGETTVSLRRLVLPEPRLGRLELVFRAAVAVPYLPPRASASVTVPMIVPQEGAWRQNRVRLLLEEGVRVQPRAGVWQGAMDSFGWIDGPEVLLYTDGGVSELQLALHRPGGRSIVVERAWVQTFLGARSRQDWAVFRLITAEPDIEIFLPPGADAEEAWAVVAVGSPENIQKIRTEVTPAGALQVFLPEHQPSQPVYLELVYRLPGQLRELRPIDLRLPQIRGDVWVQQAYWQLVLPAQWHVVRGPKEWVAEHELGFRYGIWSRQPVLDELELAAWAGAIHLRKIPEQAEVYLFARQDSLAAAQVVLMRRPSIVMAASGLVLLVGLAFLYVPALRRPAALWLFAVAVTALAFVDTENALLLGQAGILGVVLVGVAAILRRVAVASPTGLEAVSTVAAAPSGEMLDSGPLSAAGSFVARTRTATPSSSVYS